MSTEAMGVTTIPHPLNYPDATVTQVDATVKMKSLITKFPCS